MLGTFGGALEARQIDASNGKLVAEVTGEVEAEEGVLVIRRIHVAMPVSYTHLDVYKRQIMFCNELFQAAFGWQCGYR